MPSNDNPESTPIKQCSKCREWKSATTQHFACDRKRRDGFRSCCKDCQREIGKEYRERYKEEIKQRKKSYYLANRDRLLQKFKVNHSKNREEDNRRAARYYAANKDKWPKWQREYNRRNREEVNRKMSVVWQRRNARIRAAEGTHTDADVRRQYEAQNRRCYYCNCELNGKYETDHVVPLSRGGANGMENIVVACSPCNKSKGTKLPHEWGGSNRLL